MSREEIHTTVTDFIRKNFIFDLSKPLSDTESLHGTGVIDSTGILELISHLETTYKLRFEDQELVGENFDSVNKITSFLLRKVSEKSS